VDSTLYSPPHNSAPFLATEQSRFKSRSIWSHYADPRAITFTSLPIAYMPILNTRFVVTSDNKRSFMFPLTLVLSLGCKRRRTVLVSSFYFCIFLVRWVTDTFLPRVLPWNVDYTCNHAMHAEVNREGAREQGQIITRGCWTCAMNFLLRIDNYGLSFFKRYNKFPSERARCRSLKRRFIGHNMSSV